MRIGQHEQLASQLDPVSAFVDLAPNPLTPELVSIALVTDDESDTVLAVELSRGEGIMGGDLWGVSVAIHCSAHGWEHAHPLCQSFWSLDQASEYVAALGSIHWTWEPFASESA